MDNTKCITFVGSNLKWVSISEKDYDEEDYDLQVVRQHPEIGIIKWDNNEYELVIGRPANGIIDVDDFVTRKINYRSAFFTTFDSAAVAASMYLHYVGTNNDPKLITLYGDELDLYDAMMILGHSLDEDFELSIKSICVGGHTEDHMMWHDPINNVWYPIANVKFVQPHSGCLIKSAVIDDVTFYEMPDGKYACVEYTEALDAYITTALYYHRHS